MRRAALLPVAVLLLGAFDCPDANRVTAVTIFPEYGLGSHYYEEFDPIGTPSLQRVVFVRGDTGTMHALAEINDRRTENLRSSDVAWRSSNADVATISSEGLITARAPGDALIQATYLGFSDTMHVVVTLAAATLHVTLTPSTVPVGGKATISLSATDSAGAPLARVYAGLEATNAPLVAGITPGPSVTGYAAGVTDVIARLKGQPLDASARLTVAP